MQLTKLSPNSAWLGLGLVAAAHFANDVVTSMLPALLPTLALRFELEPAQLALLVSVFAVSTSLPQPLFGLLADRLGRRSIGALGLGVSALLIAGLSIAPSVPWLWLALVLGGLGSAALHPAGLGLARAASPTNPGLAVAVFSSVGMAGGALGPVLAIGVASAWGFGQLAWAALPVVSVALLLGRLGPRPAPTIQRPSSHRSRLFNGRLGHLALVALLTNLVVLTFTSALPIWLVIERGLDETSPVIGLTLSTFSFAAGGGGVLGGVLARWLLPRSLIVASLATSVVALQGVLLTAPGSTPYVIAVATAGALLGLHTPLLIAKAQELAPGAESAVAGVLLGATSGAAGVIYAVLGAAQAAFGVGPTLAAVALLVLPAALVAASTLRACEPSPTAACAGACARELGCCAALASVG